MTLDEYRRKRSFKKTPEPAPEAPPEQKRSEARTASFFIQRHHARRLHYDLRLEAAGVLKSWAVPKGPTLDPGEKRLAVLVEDHPIDYGNFEGTIPEGNYGAGSVTVWDRGTYELLGEESFEQQMERGDLKFALTGHKLMGAFALARMKNRGKGNEWLLIKKKDFAAKPGWNAEDDTSSVVVPALDAARIPGARAAEMPAEIVPMLALPVSSAPEGPEWLFELKWDGVRALCFITKNGIRMSSRRGNRIEKQYPELARAPEYLAAESELLAAAVADWRGSQRSGANGKNPAGKFLCLRSALPERIRPAPDAAGRAQAIAAGRAEAEFHHPLLGALCRQRPQPAAVRPRTPDGRRG